MLPTVIVAYTDTVMAIEVVRALLPLGDSRCVINLRNMSPVVLIRADFFKGYGIYISTITCEILH